MRATVRTCLTAAAVLSLMAGRCQAAEIRWGQRLSTALAQARSTHRLVMVDFYTSWCGYCKRLDHEAYRDPGVIRLVEQAIPVKLDAEHNGLEAARKYNVHEFPTILFLDGDGRVENRLSGYLPTPNFANYVSSVLRDRAQLPSLMAQHRTNPGNVALGMKLMQHYVAQADIGRATSLLQEMSASDPHNRSGKLSGAFDAVGGLYAQNKRYSEAISYYRVAIRPVAAAPDVALAHMCIGYCYLMQKKANLALPELRVAESTPGAPDRIKTICRQTIDGLQMGPLN